MFGLAKFKTTKNTIYGIEIMNMIRKEQVVGVLMKIFSVRSNSSMRSLELQFKLQSLVEAIRHF
jgi:hypothetical protein